MIVNVRVESVGVSIGIQVNPMLNDASTQTEIINCNECKEILMGNEKITLSETAEATEVNTIDDEECECTEEDHNDTGDTSDEEQVRTPEPKKYYLGYGCEEDEDSDYDYILQDSWEYGIDSQYVREMGFPCQQPYTLANKSYTPPGFNRKYKYRKVPKKNNTKTSCSDDIDFLFEF